MCIYVKTFNCEKVIQANSTHDFGFANKHVINNFPFCSCWNVRIFFLFPLLLCVILLAVSDQLSSHALWDAKNSWKPFTSMCGKASNSWKLICFEFTASCCLFGSPRLCGTSPLDDSILGECGNAVSCFRCAGCVSKLAPLLSRSKKSGELLFLLASCWYCWGWDLVWLSKHEVVQQLLVLAYSLLHCPSCEGLPSVWGRRSKLCIEQKEINGLIPKVSVYNLNWFLPNLPFGHSTLLMHVLAFLGAFFFIWCVLLSSFMGCFGFCYWPGHLLMFC